ncbi:MAG TPA: multidrug efflux SMR transporter [Candidatus Acidoferrales bacterium]|nr:multidrug efflux SMR transporter [Candidatus Acidoferrales bacterium]
MAWLILVLAGACEIIWAVALKLSHGFSRVVPTAIAFGVGVVSVVLLGRAAKSIPIGTAYAVWTGIGSIGTATVGIYFFGEPRTGLRLACMTLIVAGIIGLKLVSPAQ